MLGLVGGAPAQGWGGDTAVPGVADSSAAGAGRFFHNSVPPSKQNYKAWASVKALAGKTELLLASTHRWCAKRSCQKRKNPRFIYRFTADKKLHSISS